METLPQDIIFDILLRLQVKSVGRFKCVCKSWCSLISKPEFVKTHLHRAMTDDVSVGCQRLLIPYNIHRDSLESIDYEALHLLSNKKLKEARKNKGGNACTVLDLPWSSPRKPRNHIELVGSCHGMVGMEVDYDKIVICNPCTREFRELPKPTSIAPKYMRNGGLGYDSSVDDYKFVIAVVVNDDDGSNRRIIAEVFSLRSNSWRMLHDVERDIFDYRVYGSGVFLNGALHWIACRGDVQMIISFDMATEKFQVLFPVPPKPDYFCTPYDDIYKALVVLGGNLSVSCGYSCDTQVWVMKEYGVEASWTKLCDLELMFDEDCYIIYLSPLCFSKNGELLVNVDDHIIIYNPKEQTYRKLYKGSRWKDLIVAYTESLVSPNGNVEYN